MEEKPSIMKTPRCVFLSNHTLTCVFLNYLPLNGCKSQVQGQNVGKKGVPSLNSIPDSFLFMWNKEVPISIQVWKWMVSKWVNVVTHNG